MKRPVLVAEERKILGKKVKKLRREGFLPANMYGKNLSSVALQVKITDFMPLYKEVGATGVIDLQFAGKAKPVMVKNLQMNFDSHLPLHADFYQVNLKEKIKATVPVVLTGEAKAVTEKVGMLLQSLSDVELEALPDNLPENIEIDVENLSELGDQITVGDLKAPEGVEILTDPAQTIAKIAELTVAEPEPEEEAAETEEGEAAEETSEEGGSEEEKTEEKTEEKSE